MKTYLTPVKKFLLPISIILFTLSLHAQVDILWEKSYGGSSSDRAYSVISNADGGYLLVGSTQSTDGDVTGYSGANDFWVVKTDMEGNLLWQKTYGGSDEEVALDAIELADGFILFGYSASLDGDMTDMHGVADYWLLKIDFSGNLIWQNNLGGSLIDHGHEVHQTSDGGFILCGQSKSTNFEASGSGNNGKNDFWIVKTDSLGNLQWQKAYGGSEADIGNAILVTDDGGFVACGYANSSNGDIGENMGFGDAWVFRCDSNGEIIWSQVFGGSGDDFARAIIPASTGGYFLVGGTSSNNGDIIGGNGSTDIWLLKLDDAGELIYSEVLGGSGFDVAYDVLSYPGGGYLIAGASNSVNGDIPVTYGATDFLVLKVNEEGGVEWIQNFGGSASEEFRSVIAGIYGGFIASGFTESSAGDISSPKGGYDFWLVHFGAPEICNDYDDNANSITDEGCAELSITISGADSICKGAISTLCANPTEFTAYQWYRNGNAIAGATTECYNTNKQGSYSVRGIIGTDTVISESHIVSLLASPNANINVITDLDLCPDNEVKLKANNGAGLTYQWIKGTSVISGATSQIFTATATGTYRVQVTNSIGCIKTSTPVIVSNSGCRIGLFDEEPFQIYPNPANNVFFISFNQEWHKSESVWVHIYNLQGALVYSENFPGWNIDAEIQIQLQDQSKGAYIIYCTNGILQASSIVELNP